MKYRIVVGNEPYLIDQYIAKEVKNYTVKYSDVFTSEEILLLRQLSIFDKNAVVVGKNLCKEQEADLLSMIKENFDISGLLFYVPEKLDARKKIFKLQNHLIRFDKPSIEEVFSILIEACDENDVPYKATTLQYLIDYSEYYEEDKISLYELLNVIRTTAGNEITEEHINKTMQRCAKDNAFELIKLIADRDKLIEYMNRLTINSYQIIGALNYSFRIMAKLKLSDNININSYVKRQYMELSERWEYNEIVDKLKQFYNLKQAHETNDVAKALILKTLLE
jgi:hypothetical protein